MIKSAGLLILKNHQVLLVKPKSINADVNWSIPKGIIDPEDKNIIHTAIRETFEETGLKIPEEKIDISKRSVISYVDAKGILTKVIFYFVVEISEKEFEHYKISDHHDGSEIETFGFFSMREARKKMFWKQHSALNFLNPESFCLNELEHLIELGYIYKVKHPVFPLWLYNITGKCKLHRNWNYTTLSCRGLILNDSGQIIARPFKKFFEEKDLFQEILDILPDRKIVKEKLDGALGVSYVYKENYYICCKNNFGHYSGIVATDAFYNEQYSLELPLVKDHTFLFEIISSKIPFTVNYAIKDRVVAIGAVDNKTAKNNFPVLESLEDTEISNGNFLREGLVEYFDDGTMVKVKNRKFLNKYDLLKKSKDRTFKDGTDPFSYHIFDRKKIMDHSTLNSLKNLQDFFNSDASDLYSKKMNYWI